MNGELSVMDGPSPAASRSSAPVSQALAWFKPLGRQVWQCLAIVAAAAVSYLFITQFVFRSAEVVGNSMQPALHNAEHCLLNLWILRLRDPKRGDIVAFRDPQDHRYSVKRIIGVAGDSILLRDGPVYLNGRKFVEPYLARRTPTYPDGRLREQHLRCGKDQYIVLGDNRTDSTDSRSYGPIPRASILGLVR
jgi:signal peptidase I